MGVQCWLAPEVGRHQKRQFPGIDMLLDIKNIDKYTRC